MISSWRSEVFVQVREGVPRGEAGLALLQVLFVALFLAIAASVAVMSLPSQERSEGPTLTWQRMDTIKAAVARYRTNVGGNPANLDALTVAPAGFPACAPDTNPASATFRQLRGWCGPYLARDPAGSDLQKRDGWKTLLQYNGVTLASCGPNRICGDGDDITITP
jgi:hypothetical protein